MQETVYGEEELGYDGDRENGVVNIEKKCNNVNHLREEDHINEESWEINILVDLMQKMASPWQTSIILKLMGKQLGYHAQQTRLAGIWYPLDNMVLIDIRYGYFIMKFDVLKDYHHAFMDGSWFVGEQYLHVQVWEADFHPSIAKVTNTSVWICLEQLPIEYYHQELLAFGHQTLFHVRVPFGLLF